MKINVVWIFVFLILFAGCADAAEQSKEDLNFKYQTVTTKEGLTFRVPEDMPVETRNGIVAPIPFDEYMFGKFKQMDQKLKTIDAKLDRIENLLSDAFDKKPEKPEKPERSTGVLRSGSK